VVVWKVFETAEAMFEVDDFEHYVKVQSEAALRNLATSYAYDAHDDTHVSLRGHTNAVADHLKREGRSVAYEHIEIGQTEFVTPLGLLDTLLLDEADRLSEREWDRLLRALSVDGRGLRSILSSHEDLTHRFVRRGLPLTTLRFETATLTHVAAVIRRRLAHFALELDLPGVTISPEAIAHLHQTFGADIRVIEQTLYEVFQGRRERGEIGVEEVVVN